jgi:hypothetical protein
VITIVNAIPIDVKPAKVKNITNRIIKAAEFVEMEKMEEME